LDSRVISLVPFEAEAAATLWLIKMKLSDYTPKELDRLADVLERVLSKHINGLSVGEIQKIFANKGWIEDCLNKAVNSLLESNRAGLWYHEGIKVRHAAFWPPTTTIRRNSLPPF
jgi:hypothetical protein